MTKVTQHGTPPDTIQDTSKMPITKSRVSGVILIDKPEGPTSQQVVAKVKYLLQSRAHNTKKAGHTGTLDPMATGLLPVCLGEATKFSHYQLAADKSYEATVKLGLQTDTGDAQGEIVASKTVPVISQSALEGAAKTFTGAIWQLPPMYSALKKEGKKFYEYARAGIEVERSARPIRIHQLTIAQGDAVDEIKLSVTCSKGTYIRVLGEDIAKVLGTCGHLTALRRTQVSYFSVDEAISLDDFEAFTHDARLSSLLPIDACIAELPKLIVSEIQRQRLHLGQRLNVSDSIDSVIYSYLHDPSLVHDPNQGDIRLFSSQGDFLGLGSLAANGRLQPKKMIQR